MSVVIIDSGTIGAFKSIETLADRLRCDGVDYPFSVIGSYTISDNDALATVPPMPAPTIPQIVSMRQARLALLQRELLPTVDAAVAAMTGAAGDAARIEWEFSGSVYRDQPIVVALSSVLGLTSSDLDDLFLLAGGL